MVDFTNRKKPLVKAENLKNIFFLFLAAVAANLAVYIAFSSDISVVCRYLDGPHYLEVAKTFYQAVTPANSAQLPEWYFSVHLIGMPFFIRMFLTFLPDCWAMLTTVTFFTALSTVLFYLLLKEGGYVKSPFWLSLIFIFFPPRWYLYHAVAGSEPLFLTFVFASLLFYKKKNSFLAVLMAIGAALTRIFGLLIFPLLFFLYLKDKKLKPLFLSFLIPLSLLAHFSYYYFRFGDFFAYFRWNTRQIKAVPFFSQIILRITDDRTAAAEFFILVSLLTLVGIFQLKKKFPELFCYCLLLFLPIPFLIQVDFSRFFIPVFPFAWLVGFEKYFNSKIFKVLFIPLVIVSYFYLIQAVPTNLFPAKSFLELVNGVL